MILAISFIMALFICSALVPIMMRLAPSLGLVDEPDKRKVHSNPIPRAGGVAIVIAFFVPVLVWYEGGQSILAVLIGAGIIAIFGFLDDRHNLAYQWKFVAQIIAVAVFLAGNVEITKTPFLGLGDVVPWLSYPILALFILGVTNAVNLSDGLDGLAAGSSLLSLAFIAVLSYSFTEYGIALLAVASMGAVTGFLRFNTHPASIFMGDTGSQFLGFMTASLAILMTQSQYSPVSPLLAVLVVGLPILDTLLVIALRLRTGDSPFKPDKRHMHHQLLRAGMEHYQAVAAIYIMKLALLAMAYVLRFESDWVVFGAYLGFCAVVLVFLGYVQHSPFAKRKALEEEKNERRNPFFRKLSWFHANGERTVQATLGLVCVLYVAAGSPAEIAYGLPAILLGLILALFWFLRAQHSPLVNRIVIYSTCVVSIYIGVYERVVSLPIWRELSLLDATLALLALVLAIAIRTTRRDQFRLDNQDLLVLMMLVLAPLVVSGGADSEVVARAVVRLAVVLYAAEFVISKVRKPVVLACFCVAVWAVLSLKLLI